MTIHGLLRSKDADDLSYVLVREILVVTCCITHREPASCSHMAVSTMLLLQILGYSVSVMVESVLIQYKEYELHIKWPVEAKTFSPSSEMQNWDVGLS